METTRFGGLRRFLALAVAARYYLALLFGQPLYIVTDLSILVGFRGELRAPV